MSSVQNPYARAVRITWVLAVVAALLFLAGLPLRNTSAAVLPVLLLAGGAMLFLGCAITLPVLYLYGRLARRQIQAVLDGGHWAHWVYARPEWEKFVESEWAAARSSAVRNGLGAAVWMIPVGIFLHFIGHDVSLAQGALFGVAMGIVVGPIVGGLSYLLAHGTYRSRIASPGEVYIAPSGVYQNGSFTSWEMAGVKLDGVTLEPGDPRVLQFTIIASRGGSANCRVAVPSDKATEARHIVDRFRERQQFP